MNILESAPSTRSAASVSPWVSLPKKVILSNCVLVGHDGVDMSNTRVRLSNRVEDAINGRTLQFHPLAAHRDHVENESASIHNGKHSLVLFCARQPRSNALHRSLKIGCQGVDRARDEQLALAGVSFRMQNYEPQGRRCGTRGWRSAEFATTPVWRYLWGFTSTPPSSVWVLDTSLEGDSNGARCHTEI